MKLSDYIENKPVLKTERLILRELEIKDVEDLREWTAEKSLYEYWGKNAGKADKHPEYLFEHQPRKVKSFHWGIELKSEQKIIGELWVYLIENDRMAKVAYRISPFYHRKGYATEALREAVRFCFEETELQRLWSGVDIRNTASCRVMEKCGFMQEGCIHQGKMGSSWCDYYLYGLLREQWLRAEKG